MGAAIGAGIFALAPWSTSGGRAFGAEDHAANSTRAVNDDVDHPAVASSIVSPPPDPNDWTTEQFDELAEAQLKKLASLLGEPTVPPPAQFTQVVHEEYKGEALSPPTTRLVFHDRVFEVHRGETASPSAEATARLVGLGSFLEGIQRWRGLLQEGESSRWTFKVIDVTLAIGSAQTTVLVEMVGRAPRGKVEAHGRWQVRWAWVGETAPRIIGATSEDFEFTMARLDHPGPPRSLFADITEAVLASNASYREQLALGLDHWLGRVEARWGMDTSGWQGLALGDANGDGLDDVFVCQPGGLPQRLYVRNPDGTLTDASEDAGVDWLDDTSSALFIDFDNDGDQDLALATALGVLFLENEGASRFKPAAAKFMPHAAPSSMAAADFDGDGDVDLFVCGYTPRRSALTAGFLGRPIPYHDANNGGQNVLFRNDGNFRFTNVTRKVGLDANNRRFSLAAAWEDYDNDGDLDLYVANDYGRNNLYRNDRGAFVDVAPDAGVEDMSAGMSVCFADCNHDGAMDLYIGNMWSSAGHRVTFQRRFMSDANPLTRQAFQRHARGNSLFLNAGDGTFRDVSIESGVAMGRWAWSSLFVDLNNDGWEDLFVANGYITGSDPGDL